jgi:hypothetical protein
MVDFCVAEMKGDSNFEQKKISGQSQKFEHPKYM